MKYPTNSPVNDLSWLEASQASTAGASTTASPSAWRKMTVRNQAQGCRMHKDCNDELSLKWCPNCTHFSIEKYFPFQQYTIFTLAVAKAQGPARLQEQDAWPWLQHTVGGLVEESEYNWWYESVSTRLGWKLLFFCDPCNNKVDHLQGFTYCVFEWMLVKILGYENHKIYVDAKALRTPKLISSSKCIIVVL